MKNGGQIMDLNKYQMWTRTTRKLSGEQFLIYARYKLVGEVGEIFDKIGKQLRGDDVTTEDIMQECGDVLWYVCAMKDVLRVQWTSDDMRKASAYNEPSSSIMFWALRVFNFRTKSANHYNLLTLIKYLRGLCMTYGYTLEQVADLNVKKLEDRKARGVIQGSGDTR